MNHTVVEILSYSIGIAAIAGLVRFRQLDQAYYPFIILLWTGLLNEIISTVSINLFYSNAVASNIYVLLESLLALVFFEKLHLFKKRKVLYPMLAALFITCWSIENFFMTGIGHFGSYFRILYSFAIVLMSIHTTNNLILEEKGMLIRNPVFLIMIGFIAFFTYKILIEIFWVYGLNASRDFRVEVYRILTYINLSVNLIYAITLIWMPGKREYTLL
jgi:hypothetical protein